MEAIDVTAEIRELARASEAPIVSARADGREPTRQPVDHAIAHQEVVSICSHCERECPGTRACRHRCAAQRCERALRPASVADLRLPSPRQARHAPSRIESFIPPISLSLSPPSLIPLTKHFPTSSPRSKMARWIQPIAPLGTHSDISSAIQTINRLAYSRSTHAPTDLLARLHLDLRALEYSHSPTGSVHASLVGSTEAVNEWIDTMNHSISGMPDFALSMPRLMADGSAPSPRARAPSQADDRRMAVNRNSWHDVDESDSDASPTVSYEHIYQHAHTRHYASPPSTRSRTASTRRSTPSASLQSWSASDEAYDDRLSATSYDLISNGSGYSTEREQPRFEPRHPRGYDMRAARELSHGRQQFAPEAREGRVARAVVG